MEACETCKYWTDKQNGIRLNICRRFPPTPVATSSEPGHIGFFFSETAADNWCGEYEARND